MKPLHMLMGLFAILPGTAFAQDGETRAFDGVQVGVSVDRRTLDGGVLTPDLGGADGSEAVTRVVLGHLA